jgi:acyl-[acyl-carrier-protein]-phospholipid O-acyltransferase/long-chain-fatty-acid--[acyl-carrier-protein] ligase
MEDTRDAAATEPPPLSRDPAFWGMTLTQFLGAFNDNVFKQLVLLIGLDYARLRGLTGDPYQTYAQGLFAMAFVLFSGLAGWLSDRNVKRSIVVASKVAEIVVMGAGLAVFVLLPFGSDAYLGGLLAVLFLMGTQSAFFGPGKYGILPEMLRERDLPAANGVIQMTTFLAIIFGIALCGYLKEHWGNGETALWKISALCIGIAVVGTLTSLLVRPTQIAAPGLPFRFDSLLIDRPTLRMLREDRTLRGALAATVLFWFLGGVTLPVVNTLGKDQLGLGDAGTSVLTASVGFGIAVGCLTAGSVRSSRAGTKLVRGGAGGMLVMFSLLGMLPRFGLDSLTTGRLAGVGLVLLGVAAGLYAVPLQVVLQTRPPASEKGRMIGAMNLCTWIGIFAAAGFYGLCAALFTREQISHSFFVLGALIAPVLLWYRPGQDLPDASVRSSETAALKR